MPSPLALRIRLLTGSETVRLATLVASAAFLIDWATKSWALDTVHDVTMPLGNLVLGVARNDAFAFSSGAGWLSPAAIAAARLLVLIPVLYVSRKLVLGNRRYATGIALLTAGGFGNAADLVFRDGAVVDFIGAGPFVFSWRGSEPVHLTLVFNIADIAILIGVGLIAPMMQAWAINAQQTVQARLRSFVQRIRTTRNLVH